MTRLLARIAALVVVGLVGASGLLPYYALQPEPGTMTLVVVSASLLISLTFAFCTLLSFEANGVI